MDALRIGGLLVGLAGLLLASASAPTPTDQSSLAHTHPEQRRQSARTFALRYRSAYRSASGEARCVRSAAVRVEHNTPDTHTRDQTESVSCRCVDGRSHHIPWRRRGRHARQPHTDTGTTHSRAREQRRLSAVGCVLTAGARPQTCKQLSDLLSLGAPPLQFAV